MDLFSLVATLGLDTSSFDGALGKSGNQFKKFAGAVLDFSKDVLDTGMNFDKAMSSVQAVLGEQEGTVENMNRLRSFALDQARDSIFTAEQTADAYYYMGMAGWKSEQMMKGLPGIMDLAAASGEDLATTSDIVTDSITAFGLTADDVTDYVNILAQAATNSNTDVYRMGQTFKYVAPIAGALGADVDDVALSIGLMANAGIKGSMAGTALRQIFTRISTNAGETNDKLGAMTIINDKLGVQFRDSTGKMRDWGDIIRECRVAWRDLDDETQIYYAKQIASERGMSGWLAMMNATEEDVDKLAEAFDNAGGAAQRMADVQLENLYGDIEMFHSSLDVLKIAIYDDVNGPLREVVQWWTDALDRITDAVNEKGLTGGIHQLSVEILDFSDKYKDEIAELVSAIVPLATTVITELTPAFSTAAVTLGTNLADGVLGGIDKLGHELLSGNSQLLDDMNDIGNRIGKSIGDGIKESFLGKNLGVMDLISFVNPVAGAVKAGKLFKDLITGGDTPEVEVAPVMRMDEIQSAIDDAQAKGEASVAIQGQLFWVETPPEEIAAALGISEVGTTAGPQIASDIGTALTDSAESLQTPIQTAIADGGNAGGSDMSNSLQGIFEETAASMLDELTDTLGDAGAFGGSRMADNIDTQLSSATPSMRDELTDTLGDAGPGIGERIASDIGSSLASSSYSINVRANVSGLPSQRNASAMSAGRIFTNPTIFGYANGAYQVAGDAGPEAVIGTHSLAQLITNAVSRGETFKVPRASAPRTMTVVVQVGESELGRIVTPIIEAEQQRVGVKLATGGVY